MVSGTKRLNIENYDMVDGVSGSTWYDRHVYRLLSAVSMIEVEGRWVLLLA